MKNFSFDLPTEIEFGLGVYKELPKELEEGKRVLIVSDPGLKKVGLLDKIINVVSDNGFEVDVYTEITPNPDEELVSDLTSYISEKGSEQIVVLGGGSSIDAAKVASCMAVNDGPLEDYQWNNRSFENCSLPLFVFPTTAGTGSEVTGVAVITSRNTKKGVVDKYIFPDKAIVDPVLMKSLPPYLTAITGMDALTHAIEAYLGLGANAFTDSLAERAIKLIADYLPRAYANGEDEEARYNMAVASTLAGIAMDQAGLGIVHSLASPVCANLHLSHGLANSFLLPYGMEFNLIARKEKMSNIAELMGVKVADLSKEESAYLAVRKVEELQSELELKDKIAEETNVKPDLDKYAENAANMFLINNNPRKASIDECRNIFKNIFYSEK
ncbi:MAG: iron-containing alcohol dehydrogenase [Bacillota bacterium]